jgi:hypothetical protein
VVDAARLEHDALVGPAHGPVDLPDQLAAVELVQPDGLGEAAGVAGVRQLGAVVVVGGDGGEVLLAVAAVRLVREVPGGAGAAVVLGGGAGAFGGFELGLVEGLLLLLLRRGLLGAVLVEDRVDVAAVAHGVQDLLAIDAGGVLLGLADPVELDAQLGQGLDHRGLEVLGPVRVRGALRGGDGGQRLADVLGPGLLVDADDALGHLAVAVVVVPGDQVSDLASAPPDLVGDEVRGHDLTQVPEVDRAGRGEAGGDDDRFARGPTLRLLDDLIRETGDPVGGLGALSHDRHVLLF